ncbi:hypothetical protein [Kribbella sp. NPDC055071]
MRKPHYLIAAALTASVALTTLSLTGGPLRHADAAQIAQPRIVLPRIESYTPADGQRGYLRRADTKERFIPRGVNYIRLSTFQLDGQDRTYHSTFEPGLYDATRADAMLAQLQHDQYNTVRVFIDAGDGYQAEHGHLHGIGRGAGDNSKYYQPYLDNVGDFVRRATQHHVYVQFSMDAFPQNDYYRNQMGPIDPTKIYGQNLYYLHPGLVKVKAEYMTNFVNGLREEVGDAGMSGVLAYASDNEAFVEGSQPPFSLTSGQVATADGLSYDMGDPAQRQQAQDANFVHYAITMANAVKEADPQALTTMGAFTYAAVGKPGPQGLPTHCSTDCNPQVDYRYPVRLASLTTWAKLPYVDLHLYTTPAGLQQQLNSIEWDLIKGPVVVGEYGAYKPDYDNDVIKAAYGMRDVQRATCAKGMTGWLFWTYDTTEEAVQRQFFNLADSGGAVNGTLAPIVRPDPCS